MLLLVSCLKRFGASAKMSVFRSGKSGDIVSTLVSIYDTREVIIKELQVLLATRLFAVKDYDAVREVRPLHRQNADSRSAQSNCSSYDLANLPYRFAMSCSRIWPIRNVSTTIFRVLLLR